ncbi:zinc finger MYND domain-containing protein 12 [Centroberyx affinis]|uniref:zinc finger MYND domain-containing protein 12 n=1 Tax=Centroberyx affinis TaxID=166261 RepID=UPI003A5BF599
MASKPQVSGVTAKIIPLAIPKGAKKLCELCQKPAHLQCSKCRVTFYCDTEHQQADWVGIHERICQLLVPIRSPASFHPLQADREIHHSQKQLQQEQLVEISRTVAQSKLAEGKHQEALPAAQFSLRCAMDVYGSSAVQLVPAYLLLAEANVGLGSLAQAGECLSHAEWAVLKSPDCGQAVRQQLHRNLGRLYTTTGNLEAALLNFANDVYYASEEYGLDSTVTCGGYFLMANVFVKQGKMLIAHSLYSEVAHTWHSYLTKLFEIQTQNVQNSTVSLESSFDEAQRAEVDQMLRTMLEVGENDSSQDTAQTALVTHCLAMLCFLGGDPQKALEFGSRALQASQLIPNHDLTEPIQGLLQLVQTGQHPGTDAS